MGVIERQYTPEEFIELNNALQERAGQIALEILEAMHPKGTGLVHLPVYNPALVAAAIAAAVNATTAPLFLRLFVAPEDHQRVAELMLEAEADS